MRPLTHRPSPSRQRPAAVRARALAGLLASLLAASTLLTLTVSAALAATTPVRYPSAHTAYNSPTTFFQGPEKAYVATGDYTYRQLLRSETASGDFRNFGFNGVIPAGQVIDGVTVETRWQWENRTAAGRRSPPRSS